MKNISYAICLTMPDPSGAVERSEWVTNQHRDTYASHVAHYDQLSYFAVAQNQSIGRARLEFLQKMIQPCGP